MEISNVNTSLYIHLFHEYPLTFSSLVQHCSRGGKYKPKHPLSCLAHDYLAACRSTSTVTAVWLNWLAKRKLPGKTPKSKLLACWKEHHFASEKPVPSTERGRSASNLLACWKEHHFAGEKTQWQAQRQTDRQTGKPRSACWRNTSL